MTEHRTTRLSWDEFGMMAALVAAQRSPDPNTQVGACILDPNNVVKSTGYNGWPRGIDNDSFPWDRTGEPLAVKYTYVVHAEANAIVNANGGIAGGTLYVTMYPCNECAKLIIQAGIKRVVYLTNPYKETWQVKASERMFSEITGLRVVEFSCSPSNIEKSLEQISKSIQATFPK